MPDSVFLTVGQNSWYCIDNFAPPGSYKFSIPVFSMANSDPIDALALLGCREGDAQLEYCLVRDLTDLVNVSGFCAGKDALRLLRSAVFYINESNADWARLICQKIIAIRQFSEVLNFLTEPLVVNLLNNINYYVYDNLLDCIVVRAIDHEDTNAIQFIYEHLLLPRCIEIVCGKDFGEDDTGPNLDRPLLFSQKFPEMARVAEWNVQNIYKRLLYSRQSFEIFCSILSNVVQIQSLQFGRTKRWTEIGACSMITIWTNIIKIL